MPKKILSAVVPVAKGAHTGCFGSQELNSCFFGAEWKS